VDTPGVVNHEELAPGSTSGVHPICTRASTDLREGVKLALCSSLEGDLLATAAVHELLLQAWSIEEVTLASKTSSFGTNTCHTRELQPSRGRSNPLFTPSNNTPVAVLCSPGPHTPVAVLCSPGPMAREMSGKPSRTNASVCCGSVAVTRTNRKLGGAASLRESIWLWNSALSPEGDESWETRLIGVPLSSERNGHCDARGEVGMLRGDLLLRVENVKIAQLSREVLTQGMGTRYGHKVWARWDDDDGMNDVRP